MKSAITKTLASKTQEKVTPPRKRVSNPNPLRTYFCCGCCSIRTGRSLVSAIEVGVGTTLDGTRDLRESTNLYTQTRHVP